MQNIFGDSLVGALYETIADEKEDLDSAQLAGLALGFFIVWILLSLIAAVISLVWPLAIILLLFILLFNIKKPIKK